MSKERDLKTDIAQVDTPTGRTIPQWITLGEAGLLTGLPEQTLARCVESGLVASDSVLSRRLGMTFVLVDSHDLVKAGLLRPSDVRDEHIEAILKGREQVDLRDLQSPAVAIEAGPPPTPETDRVTEPAEPLPAEPAIDLKGMALPEWVTLREAAFITRLSEQALQRQVDLGVISSHALGRRRGAGFVLVRSSDLERAVRMDEEPAPAPELQDLAPVDLTAPGVETPPEPAPATPARPAEAPPAPAPVLVAQPGDVARTGSPTLKWIRRLVVWAALLAAGLTLLLVMTPLAFGYHSAPVRTGDMEPAYHVGDLVIAKTVSPQRVRAGDVVTFRDPANPRRLIIQRVQTVDAVGGSIRLTTRPDAGGSVIEWSVPVEGRVGVVARRFGSFGHLLTFVQSRVGQVILIVFPLLALGLLLVVRTWRRPTHAEPHPPER